MLFKALTVFLAMVSVACADEQVMTPQQWLEKVNQSMKTLNYQGTVVFVRNGQLETMKYVHTLENGIEREQLISLNSPFREVTRKSGEVSCLFKESGQKVINHHPVNNSFIFNLPQDLTTLDKIYVLSLLGKEAIAMLPAQTIAIQPRDQMRYPRKIWIDSQHFLPLKVEVYGFDGVVLEQVIFTDLQFDAIASTTIVEDKNIQIKHIHAAQTEPLENAPFILTNWPVGFKPLFFMRNSLEQSQKSVDHLLISDGFSAVSVYLEPKNAEGLQGLTTLGALNTLSRQLGNYQLTVLGEVPAAAVEFIAEGITLR